MRTTCREEMKNKIFPMLAYCLCLQMCGGEGKEATENQFLDGKAGNSTKISADGRNSLCGAWLSYPSWVSGLEGRGAKVGVVA